MESRIRIGSLWGLFVLLTLSQVWAQGQSLAGMLEEEEPFYTNYGLEPYAKEEIQTEQRGHYDRFGSHIVDGFRMWQKFNNKEGFRMSGDEAFDSTGKSVSNELTTGQFFTNFNNLVMTRDAIGGTKTTFLVGDQIRTRFTPFTMNKLNYRGIRWDLWTSGVKFTALASRTRPGILSMAAGGKSSGMAPVTYPLFDGSFVDRSTAWRTERDFLVSQYRQSDYSNKSPYGDYDFFWGLHAENDLANVMQYGITYMNHHRSDVEKGEKWSGELPDGWVPDEIHFEFYDLTLHRTDDAGCYIEDMTMTINGQGAAKPWGVYTVDFADSTLYSVRLPREQDGEVPTVATFHPKRQRPATIPEDQIKHVKFKYTVGGNYVVFVSTERFVPLGITGIVEDKVKPQIVIYFPPRTRSIEQIAESDKPITSNQQDHEGATYFGQYIAKAPKLIKDKLATNPAAYPNKRDYEYEFRIDVNSVTYGANVKGKLFGINFEGEIATNTREGKYPGKNNKITDYEKIRRNILQFKADRDFGKKLNLEAEVFSVAPGWETNLDIPQPSRYLRQTTYAIPKGAPDYLTYPKPLSNDWRAVDDNEDEDLYVENNRRIYPANYATSKHAEFHYDGAIQASLTGASGSTARAETLFLPTGMNTIYDDEDGVISNRYDRNKNGRVDYREDFLLYYTDPPFFELENDLNFNGTYDYEDDDLLPDYPYALPYTITSNGLMTHGIQGVRGKFEIKASSNLVFNVGARIENAMNMNFTPETEKDDKPESEGKAFMAYGNGMLKVTRRSQGIDYFVGDEVFFVQDGIRNDVVQTGAGLDITQATGIGYHFLTDQLRYRNAVVNNLVGGLTYMNIPNFEWNLRLLLGYEQHLKKDEHLYITKTRADYTYESFWETYPDRAIAKTFFVNKFGYAQKWSLEYEGWQSMLNVLNRLTIEPQFKLAYEFKRNLKSTGSVEDTDPRKNARVSKMSEDEQATYKNDWQEFDANTEDFLLSVPILRANYQIAEKTRLEAGIQWMKTFDRVSEQNSFAKTVKVAQIVTRDNYAGYNIALIIGLNNVKTNYDVNLRDELLGTGSEFNPYNSEFFAEIYAGL